ncbi:MAG: divergent PAP2 family protein [Dehalococcoidales bacterium]|nr:divergent PAP2 family protein [Dehalococcoidales bacterium]
MFYEFITNKVLIAPAIAWAIAQVAKFMVALAQEKRIHLRYLVSSGGMPSAHSATVTALATAVALTDGVSSVSFGIATVLAIVVMYDAAGVRQSVSRQSAVLDRIVEELRLRRPLTKLESYVREFVGHTPFQVFVGAAIGVIIAWLWFLIAT